MFVCIIYPSPIFVLITYQFSFLSQDVKTSSTVTTAAAVKPSQIATTAAAKPNTPATTATASKPTTTPAPITTPTTSKTTATPPVASVKVS